MTAPSTADLPHSGRAPPVPDDARLQMERAITRCLLQGLSLVQAAPQAIRTLCEALGWRCGALWRIPPDGQMACVGAWGDDTDATIDAFLRATRAFEPWRHPRSLIQRAWRAGAITWLPDLSADNDYQRKNAARAAGLNSALAVALYSGERVAGVLEFYDRDIADPAEPLRESLRHVGSQIGALCDQVWGAPNAHADTQQSLRTAFEHASVGIGILQLDGRWKRVNKALARMLGYTPRELVALEPAALQPNVDGDGTDLAHEFFARTHERCYLRRDGHPIWASVSLNPVLGPDRRPIEFIAVISDITVQKRAMQLQQLEHAVTRCLAESEDADAAVAAIIRAVCQAEGWACGEYWGLDRDTQVLRFGGFWSAMDEPFDRVFEQARRFEFAPGTGLAGRVWQSGAPLWISDVTLDSRMLRRELAAEVGLHGAFLFPVTAGSETQGVFAFWSRVIREPDQALLAAIHTIGSQVGQFLRRKRAEEVLRESEQRFHDHTIELAAIGVAHIAPDGRFIHVSRWLCQLLGYAREELLALTHKQVAPAEDQDATDDQRANLHAGLITSFQIEQRYLRKDGSPVWVSLINSLKRSPEGEVLFEISMVQDVSKRRLADERIKYLATHDGLTGLPNRVMFVQLLRHALEGARRYARSLAVLFIDLDRFKIVNDTLGHEAGDHLLRIVAGRLKDTLRGSDVVARLGGDEFVVLLEETQDSGAAAQVAQSLLSAVMQPITVAGRECRVTASIGVATFPGDADDEQALMKNADIAMYFAKEEGKNNFQFYSHDIKSHALEKLALETALRGALDNGEFALHYQAKLDLASGTITGVEALLRWTHPELGAVTPAQFIPLAEETGLIVPIGRWVLRTACAQTAAWRRQGLPEVCMAVNLSPRQFGDAELLNDVAAALRDTAMPPHLLELEITEGMVMQDPDRTVHTLHAIKQMGVRLAIDDFGTGYSSLAQLKRFPIDTLKVDRSFVRDLPANPEDKAITEAIIAMGKTLSLTVVAEGVETLEQKAFLQSRECDQMQGYYFSKPITAEQFEQLLGRHDPAAFAGVAETVHG